MSFLRGIYEFFNRQAKNFRVLVVQQMEFYFSMSINQVYQSLYIVGLGANVEQVGFLTALGTLGNAINSFLFGWLTDRYNQKKVVLAAIALGAGVPLIYARATSWEMLIPACFLGAGIGTSVITLVTNVVIANSLKDGDRATGISLIRSLSIIPSIIGPMIAAYIVSSSGGLTAEGIRPLYLLIFVMEILILVFSFIALEGTRKSTDKSKVKSSVVQSFKAMFKEGKAIKRITMITLLDGLAFGMITPYVSLFAVRVKGATPAILGLTAVATAIGTLLFVTPIGRLADKIGRRRAVVFVAKPLYYLFGILMILAPSPEFLVIPFLFRSMDAAYVAIWQTLQMELVPADHRGKWNGVIALFRPITQVPASIIGALLWTNFAPATVFIAHVVLDLCLTVPMFWSLPETLKSNDGEKRE